MAYLSCITKQTQSRHICCYVRLNPARSGYSLHPIGAFYLILKIDIALKYLENEERAEKKDMPLQDRFC